MKIYSMKTLNWLFNLRAAADPSWCRICVTFNAWYEVRSWWKFSFVEKVYESNYKSNIDTVSIALNTNIREHKEWVIEEYVFYKIHTKVLIYCSLVKYIVANILTDLATVISSVQTISKENRTIPGHRARYWSSMA